MTARRGSRGIGRAYPPEIPTHPPYTPGDRTGTSSYPPERSTYETPAQGHKYIDVTGDPGDRTPFLTTRDVRDEKTPTSDAPCDPMCPHSDRALFFAHHEKGPKLPPDHPEPPAHRCICGPDQRTQPGSAPNLSPGEPEPIPREPERIGPLAEQFLDRLAAQQADPDLAARRRAAIARLTRAHTTSPLTRKEQP